MDARRGVPGWLRAGAVWLGVQVARYRRIQTREKAPHMGPILAARAVAYAQGSIMTGALLTGWCAAILGYHVAMVSVRGFSVVFWEVLVIVWAVLPC